MKEKQMKTTEVSRMQTLGASTIEAIKTLCVKLLISGTDAKKVLVTSCQGEKEKVLVAINMMRTLVSLDKRVVLVDGDLAGAILAKQCELTFGEGKMADLTRYLEGKAEASDVIYLDDVSGGYIVPSLNRAEQPLSLLSSKRFATLLNELAGQFDIVLIHAAPICTSIETVETARSCDAALIVVEHETVRKSALREARNQIEQTGCRVLGTVLAGVPANAYFQRFYAVNRKDW